MLIIIKYILSFSSIVLIGIYFLIYSRNKNYSRNLFYKRCGIECFNCSSTLIDDIQISNLQNQNNLNLCLSCKRDLRLKKILKKISRFRYHFDKWILSKKSEYFTLGLVMFSLSIVVSSIVLGEYRDFISVLNSSLLITHWLVSIYRICINNRD
jgi:hypothetical protein